MIARNLQFIWRIVLKSEPHALIVIKSAENEVNRLTNPCKTCILYIVFTNKSVRINGVFDSLPRRFAYGNLFPSYRMAQPPSRFFWRAAPAGIDLKLSVGVWKDMDDMYFRQVGR